MVDGDGREIIGYCGEKEEGIRREEMQQGHGERRNGEKNKTNPTALMHPRLEQK
jgi:hypothetical protein